MAGQDRCFRLDDHKGGPPVRPGRVRGPGRAGGRRLGDLVLGGKLAAWSARIRYGETARAEIRAEELAAVINDRPGKLLKLTTGLAFFSTAAAARVRRVIARDRHPMADLPDQLPSADRRFVLEDEPSTLVARYLFPNRRPLHAKPGRPVAQLRRVPEELGDGEAAQPTDPAAVKRDVINQIQVLTTHLAELSAVIARMIPTPDDPPELTLTATASATVAGTAAPVPSGGTTPQNPVPKNPVPGPGRRAAPAPATDGLGIKATSDLRA